MIPARIGSKGIPKKVLRPFRGKPLIDWALEAALLVPNASVFVNTDGEEISDYVKKKFPDVFVFIREAKFSGDLITLDQLCFDFITKNVFDNSEILITIQPTSPFITAEIINDVINELEKVNSGSVITVSGKKKLTWKKTEIGFQPIYEKRKNRQELEFIYEENGAVLACFLKELKLSKTRINEPVNCVVVSEGLDYDLDTPLDWRMATEFGITKKLVIVIIANTEFGSGHYHRAIGLMNYFPDYEIKLVGLNLDENFKDECLLSNYDTKFIEDKTDLFEICNKFKPSLIMLDILNTKKKFIQELKSIGSTRVISFEDTGSGSDVTDLTINELYPSITDNKNILSGPKYSLLREEFDNLNLTMKRDIDILITFGGTDPGDITIKTLMWIANTNLKNLSITLILGLGAKRQKDKIDNIIKTKKMKNCTVYVNVKSMSDLMCRSRIAITASGRTIYELAACNVQTICICQNMRQLTHLFVSEVNGIINLGYFKDVKKEDFLDVLNHTLCVDYEEINGLSDFSKSKENVLNAIRALAES
jgi:CMP-N-acetylneuraminic acid synthetase/spore coat polysaccharide biosynthesis predicted glycosyltransferase SpsG